MTRGSAIAILADNPTATPIRSLWDTVATFEEIPSMSRQGYPPHITLGLYPARPPGTLTDVFEAAFADARALVLRMVRIERFDIEPLVLWAAPAPHPGLNAMFSDLAGRVPIADTDPDYRPSKWVAHCTLGTRIRFDRSDAARAFAERPMAPFDVCFDRAELVALPTLEIVRQRSLANQASGDAGTTHEG